MKGRIENLFVGKRSIDDWMYVRKGRKKVYRTKGNHSVVLLVDLIND
jgi:hypothetical protein